MDERLDVDRLFGPDSVAVAPPLGEEALAAIPAKRGVFLLVSAEGRPILLTTAADMRSRLRFRLTEPQEDGPSRRADLRAITARIAWRLTHSAFETDWQFLELARAIWPRTYTELLSSRPAWFLTVEADAAIPELGRTQALDAALAERSLGPFPDRSGTEKFIEALTDAFDLCRCVQILRQAPRGSACPYKQMGRCGAPCDGTGSLADYRDALLQAARYAAGDREGLRRELDAEMRSAAKAMAFEHAAGIKARLERLADLEAPKYAHVGPARQARYVIVQSGPRASQACSFLCDRGAIQPGPLLDYPPQAQPLSALLAGSDALAAQHRDLTVVDLQRLGLVTSYLFAAPAKRGLILARRDVAGPAQLAEAIEAAAEDLKLRAPKPRGRKKAQDPAGT